jgi:DNA-binding transcriptional LysR family regulator
MNQIDNQLDLNLFRVLEALYTQGGTSGAARSLHLTQSAVSHALGRLREAFDDPLFVRQGNRMLPTERTRRVISDVQTHLRGLYASVKTREEFRPERLHQEFCLGFRDALESIIFPPLTERLAREAPGVRIFSRYVPISAFDAELCAGKLDLAIDREVRTSDRIRSVRMIGEPWCVVTVHGRAPLSLRDFLASTHVLVNQLDGGDPVDDALAAQGLRREVGLRCQHYLAACKVVLKTGWLLSMPHTYARQLAQLLPLQVSPMPFEVPALDIFMYWHAVRDDAPEHVWLRRVLIEAAVEGSGLRELLAEQGGASLVG